MCTAQLDAPSVVDVLGQPTPGPLRFWRVTVAASMRAAWSAFELPVGKDTATEGLATFYQRQAERKAIGKRRTY